MQVLVFPPQLPKPFVLLPKALDPPFESIDANNQIVGFDVDLAQALCKEIDEPALSLTRRFQSLIPSLKFRRVEACYGGHGYHSGA